MTIGVARTRRSPITSASRPNNVAEYTGSSVRSISRRSSGAREVDLLLDSKLIVEQLTRPLAGQGREAASRSGRAARRTLAGFERWSAAHVPRAQNSVADALANEAIDRVMAGGPASVVRRPWPPASATDPSP